MTVYQARPCFLCLSLVSNQQDRKQLAWTLASPKGGITNKDLGKGRIFHLAAVVLSYRQHLQDQFIFKYLVCLQDYAVRNLSPLVPAPLGGMWT